MSYTLHLWSTEHGPTDFAHAQALLDELRERPEPATDARFRALVSEIESAYGESGDDDESAVWSEWPEFRQRALLTLGLLIGELPTSLPRLHAAATRQQLVVLDLQAGEVWLPTGVALRSDGSTRRLEPAPPPAADAEPEFSDSNVAEYIRCAIEPVLSAKGFLRGRGDSWFVRKTPAFAVTFRAWLKWNHLTIWMTVDVRAPRQRPELKGYCEDWSFSIHVSGVAARNGFESAVQEQLGGMTYELPAKDWPEVRASAQDLNRMLGGPAFRFLGDMETFADLDHWANGVPDDECPFLYVRCRHTEQSAAIAGDGIHYPGTQPDLLVALLAGNPDFLDLAVRRIRLLRTHPGPLVQRAADKIEQFLRDTGQSV